MESKNKRNLMMGMLAILLIARFILVPILDWQQEQITQITAKEQRLVKTNNILARLPQINSALEQLKQGNQKHQSRYFNQASSNTFKLQMQQKVEALFSKYNLKVTNFNWVAEINEQITQVRAKISFEGETKDFAMLQLAIAQLPKLLNIKQWSLHIKQMNEHSLGNANGSIVLTAYNIVPKSEGL